MSPELPRLTAGGGAGLTPGTLTPNPVAYMTVYPPVLLLLSHTAKADVRCLLRRASREPTAYSFPLLLPWALRISAWRCGSHFVTMRAK